MKKIRHRTPLSVRIRRSIDHVRDDGVLARLRLQFSSSRSVKESSLVFEVLSDLTGLWMVDVGAHVGESLEDFHRASWPILAFEPDKRNRERLRRRVPESERILLDARALSDRCAANVEFFRSNVSSGISSLVPFDASHALCDMVDVTTLAAALVEHAIDADAVGFLKIDAEGNDLRVLRGAGLGTIRPMVIQVEFATSNERGGLDGFHAVGRLLTGYGYTVYVSEWEPVTAYGSRHQWSGLTMYPCEPGAIGAWGNFVAFVSPDHAASFAEKLIAVSETLR